MAAGGGADNPFSFNKFLKNRPNGDPSSRGESGSDSDIEDDNVVDLLENSPSLDKAEDCESKKSSTDNPFSFKKFLQAGQGASSSRSHPLPNNGLSLGGGLATLDLANDLPDFVQDHYHHVNVGDHSRSSRHQPPGEILACLPDFALDSASAAAATSSNGVAANIGDSNLQYLFSPMGGGGAVGGLPPPDIENLDSRRAGIGLTVPSGVTQMNGARSKLSSSDNGDLRDSDLDDDDINIGASMSSQISDRANSTGGLPDFLSDSALGGILNVSRLAGGAAGGDVANVRTQTAAENGFRPIRVIDDDDVSDDEVDSAQLRRLRDANRRLHARLAEAEDLAQRESTRVSETLREMEARRKREAEDTAALETMMQQVENNLQATTQRAVCAESTIVKLKQEIKNLQSENESLRRRCSPGGAVGGASYRGDTSDDTTSSLHDTAVYASQQINTAAKNAEQLLQQLLTGVASLKQVADILASADKFTNLSSDARNRADDTSKDSRNSGT